MKVLMALTLAVLILLFQAAILMFAWAAVANTFALPAMGYGAAIALLLVIRILTYHLVPKQPTVEKKPSLDELILAAQRAQRG